MCTPRKGEGKTFFCFRLRNCRAVENPQNYSPKFRSSPKCHLVDPLCKQRFFLPSQAICFAVAELRKKPHTENRFPHANFLHFFLLFLSLRCLLVSRNDCLLIFHQQKRKKNTIHNIAAKNEKRHCICLVPNNRT